MTEKRAPHRVNRLVPMGAPAAAPAAEMKRFRAVLILPVFAFMLAAVHAGASHHVPWEAEPAIPASALEVHTHGRLFFSSGDLSGMFEYTGRFEDEDLEFRYQSFTLGGYYRIHRNVKIGAFYRLQLNARHDDDWMEEGAAWLWADTAGRAEHIAVVDVTPRFLLPFLPGKDWVASVKSRYEYNFSNGQQTLLIRPGISYFWIRDREPFLNFSAQYSGYFSLNFGAVPWYRQGPYVNVGFHLSPNILLDVGLSKQWIYWSESAQFLRDFPDEKYSNNVYSPWILDAGLVIRFP